MNATSASNVSVKWKIARQIILAAFFLVFGSGIALAEIGNVTYNPESDRPKLAGDLGIPETTMLFDQRCVFSKTNSWVASAPSDAFKTCVLVLTDERLILSNFDSSGDHYKILVEYSYSDLQAVALMVDSASKPEMYVDGKRYQVQFPTRDGFISISPYGGKQGDRPSDMRGGLAAFDLIRSKGVNVIESQGRVELAAPQSPFFMLFKKR